MVLENNCNHKSDKYFIHNMKKTYAKENCLITNFSKEDTNWQAEKFSTKKDFHQGNENQRTMRNRLGGA